MKRKSICIALCAILTASLFGCNAGDVSVSFGESKPWGNGSFAYEKCEYEIKRVYTGGGSDVTVAEGTYVTELDSNQEGVHIKNSFSLTYNGENAADSYDLSGAKVRNKNLTDTYASEAYFKKDTLTPYGTATKKYNLAQRPLNDGEMGAREEAPAEGIAYRYPMAVEAVKYGDPQGYEYTIDYDTNKSSITMYTGSTAAAESGDYPYYRNYKANTKNFTIGSGTRFDNEQLPYIVRAISGMYKKGSATFYLTNMVDSYVQDSYVRHTMGLSCAEKNTSFTLPVIDGILLRNKETELAKNEKGEYSVPCVNASVSLSDEKSGPPINMLISDPSIGFVRKDLYDQELADAEADGREPDLSDTKLLTTNRVILQMTYTEYALSSAKVAYKTIYTLKSYTTVR